MEGNFSREIRLKKCASRSNALPKSVRTSKDLAVTHLSIHHETHGSFIQQSQASTTYDQASQQWLLQRHRHRGNGSAHETWGLRD